VLALSYGERGESGELWKEPGQTEERVKELRRGEAEKAASILGAEFSSLDLGDYPLVVDRGAAERLQAARLPVGHVRTIGEVLEHPQLVARGLFAEADSPVGPIPVVRCPLSGRAGRVPGLGEDTDAVLAEAGYDAAQIAELHDEGRRLSAAEFNDLARRPAG